MGIIDKSQHLNEGMIGFAPALSLEKGKLGGLG